MLYEKKNEKELSSALFRDPTAEYRGTPFWAWNGKLEKEELLRQIGIFREMGFGGFHMHVRTGLQTPYLSEEFADLIKACTEEAKKKEMLAWLYDEDRWPSGAAGGIVTKDPAMRQRYVLFTATPYAADKQNAQLTVTSRSNGGRNEQGTLLAVYDVELENGYLKSYRRIKDASEAKHNVYYAYAEVAAPSPWFNNQAYINTLDKKAMDKFIDVTYEFYRKNVGGEFDKTIPAIFTDEPQFTRKGTLAFADGKNDVCLPWSDDLEETYQAAYGESLLGAFPELIWDLPDGKTSVTRYHYHDHVCERFTNAFADNCGKWCEEHGIALTGHMMDEPTLTTQTGALGEAMRSYRGFRLPGIDMLCARFEFTTAKQTQSAVHQYGREGMLSELYGVTGWDFDFRGHKIHGDWQAALGVTIRVPHLAWYTMKGEAKRDYPAAISYQSPWCKEYRYVEDHFARVATAMTRGTPEVKIGVIHPIESYWLHWGPAEQTAAVREQLDANFLNFARWMLLGTVDYDYISESLFPELCPADAGAPIRVGEMKYDVIIVPECETLRSTTLERLEAFRNAGGRLIFLGKPPKLENAVPSDRGQKLFDRSEQVAFSESHLLKALEDVRTVSIHNSDGRRSKNLLHQIRTDGTGKWLFIAHGANPVNVDLSEKQSIRITVSGKWNVTLYDTLTGKIVPVSADTTADSTVINTVICDCDSLLYRLTPVGDALPEGICTDEEKQPETLNTVPVPDLVEYTLDEPNVCLLDQAEYAPDEEEYRPKEEILRLDSILRSEFGWPRRDEHVAQPWTVEQVPADHKVRLLFRFTSTFRCRVPYLALEDAQDAEILLNGKKIPLSICGWYVDKAIQKVLLPVIEKGENTLEVILPFGRNTNTEWMYLLGNFSVTVRGTEKILSPLPETVSFDDIRGQGFPFYSGAFTYRIPATLKGNALSVRVPAYCGAVLKVEADGKEALTAYQPYVAQLTGIHPGKQEIRITDYIPRSNGFAPLHDMAQYEYQNPNAWRKKGDRWTYHYCLYREGILSTPQIEDLKNN